MDIAHLSLGIKDYNNFINHCRAHFKHNQINSISSHCSDSQTYCFEQYNELVTHLKQILFKILKWKFNRRFARTSKSYL